MKKGNEENEPPSTPKKLDDFELSSSRFQASPSPTIKSKPQTPQLPAVPQALFITLSKSSEASVGTASTSLGRSIHNLKTDRLPSRQLSVTVSARTILFVIGVVAFSFYGFFYSSAILQPFGQQQQQEQQEQSSNGKVRFRMQRSLEQEKQRRQILHQIEESAHNMVPCLFDTNAVCRFDYIGKFLEDNPPIPNTVHRLLRSVPSYRRIPHDKANDRDYQAQHLTNDPKDPQVLDATNATLNEYNPTILPLYKTVISNGTETLVSNLDEKLLDELTGRYHPSFSDAQADEVKYLAITRSTNHYPRCIGFQKHVDKGYFWVNYPGLVLLDENLLPIDGADVLIDLEKFYFTDRNTRVFQDFTLYAARTTKSNLNKDQLFLITNGMFVVPIDIRRVPLETRAGDHPEWTTKITTPNVGPEYVYGAGLQIKLTRSRGVVPHKVFLRMNPSARIVKGKNVHFFESLSGKDYVEVWPYNEHSVQEVDFFIDNFTTFSHYAWTIKGEVSKPDEDNRPSFVSEAKFIPMKNPVNRGTGCCADLTLADGRQVKVGVAHSVLKEGIYLHRFYAFVPKYPFKIVKLSGLFCLGHMLETDGDVQNHWLSKKEGSFDKRHTEMGGPTYDCPDITFASGITNLIGHGNDYIIISYGVDDCYSRSIIVHKKKIELLMFQSKPNATDVLYQ
ncbi:unnamed protein product [Cylindrotheca closterium]|uniref:Uncharacterized protein n=1 Tax=Cylindrotheca closterium TaxID=2856 RepID=A0AAD2PV08_9STRA|nr:unnamed protein product [Cylindrotheca closterium]